MAPPRGLSTPKALKVKTESKKQEKMVTSNKVCVFLTDLNHISHARSCIHFLWFPHTPKPPRPLKQPKNINLFFAFSNFYFLGLLFRPHWGYSYTSLAGAIEVICGSRGDGLATPRGLGGGFPSRKGGNPAQLATSPLDYIAVGRPRNLRYIINKQIHK